jgi:hypothetical protein
LRLVFGDKEQMPTKMILAELCALGDAPWSDLKGKPITDNQLARRLKSYDVESKTLRLDGGRFAKGYARADLHDPWRRYLPPILPSDKPVTGVTPVTQPILSGSDVTPVPSQGVNVTALEGDSDTGDVTPPMVPCDDSADEGNADEMGVVTPVTPVTPLAEDGRGLPEREIHTLARWYQDRFDSLRDGGIDGVDTRELDGELWQLLRKRTLPEHIDIEFERVMQAVFAV